MTDGRNSLGLRVGAILLTAATVAAIIFGIVNFQQRLLFEVPDDGASWVDAPAGVTALYIAADSPAARAGIKPGDYLLAIDGASMHRSVDVTKRLWSRGVWSEVHYNLDRAGRTFDATVLVIPAPKPLTIENYLRVVGLLYLFIGLFVFWRRWNAARAVHFYVFCLFPSSPSCFLKPANSTLFTGKSTGPRSSPPCWLPRCSFTSPWCSRSAASPEALGTASGSWRPMPCRWPSCSCT